MQTVIMDLQCLCKISRSKSPSTAPLFTITVPVLNRQFVFQQLFFYQRYLFSFPHKDGAGLQTQCSEDSPGFVICFVYFFFLWKLHNLFSFGGIVYHALMDVEITAFYILVNQDISEGSSCLPSFCQHHICLRLH